MGKQVLTLLGTASIQSYIFRSNKLKENVGASYRVLDALEVSEASTGLVRRLREIKHGGRSLRVDARDWVAYQAAGGVPKERSKGAQGGADVEILYTGGGNAALRFCDAETAKSAIQGWSRTLLEEAPGLRLSAVHEEIEDGHQGLQKAYHRALSSLARQEDGLPFGALYQAQSVFRTCVSTGMAAHRVEKGERLSEESYAKRCVVGDAKKEGPARRRWEEDFEEILSADDLMGELEFPYDLGKLGTPEGESHIAVVHADGNGIGKLLEQVVHREGRTDETFLSDLRAFSASVGQVAFQAFCEVLRQARAALPRWREQEVVVYRQRDAMLFPVQPLVYGGDDLTFVCHGKIGLSMAAAFLRAITKESVWVCGKPERISACAGVAIVPQKFPFARAYEMSEELCAAAKAKRKEQDRKGGYLDFHIVTGASVGSIETIRQERYVSADGRNLCFRPWAMERESEGDEALVWDDLVRFIGHFQQWPRSRSKALLKALGRGQEESEAFLSQCNHRGYELPQGRLSRLWSNHQTPYADAVEAMEFFARLEAE